MAFVSACAIRACVFDRVRTVLDDYVGWKELVLVQPGQYCVPEVNCSQKHSTILLWEKTGQFTSRSSLELVFMECS